MKKYYLLLLSGIISVVICAQPSKDTTDIRVKDIKLDMLRNPSNPAFIVMNSSPTEIIEPGLAPEFYTSVQNASNNFSAIPNNFGFSVTPFWWGKGAKKLSFENDFDTVNTLTFYRTASISSGIIQGIDNDDKLWRYGIGFQSALLRGKIDKSKKTAYFNHLRAYHKTYYGDINAYLNKQPDYILLEAEVRNTINNIKIIDDLLLSGAIEKVVANDKRNELRKHLEVTLKRLDILKKGLSDKFNGEKKYIASNKELDERFNEMNDRIGLKWDIGAGVAINSHNNKIDSTGIYRAGFWSDFGGDIITRDSSSASLAAFFVVRYLYYNSINYRSDNNVSLINNLNTLDLGVKIQFELIDKLNLGLETIYRVGLSGSIYESTYKINGLVQYQFGSNRMIYASFGNNFNDNSASGPEDLVITFGLNIGFGGNVDLYDLKF